MANTKHVDKKKRKLEKRKKRRELKARINSLSKKERKELRKFEGTSSQFLAHREAEKKKKKQEEKKEERSQDASEERSGE